MGSPEGEVVDCIQPCPRVSSGLTQPREWAPLVSGNSEVRGALWQDGDLCLLGSAPVLPTCPPQEGLYTAALDYLPGSSPLCSPAGALDLTQAGLMRVGCGEGKSCQGVLEASQSLKCPVEAATAPWGLGCAACLPGSQGTHSGLEHFLEEVEHEPWLSCGQDLKRAMVRVGAAA